MKTKVSIIIVSHGSRIVQTNLTFEKLAQSFIKQIYKQTTSNHIKVEITSCLWAYIELAKPSLETVLEKSACLAQVIIVIPLILLRAGHAKTDLPLAVSRCQKLYPGREWRIIDVFGIDPTLIKIASNWISDGKFFPINKNRNPNPSSLGINKKSDAVIVWGRGSSDPDANADFYKIVRLIGENIQTTKIFPAFASICQPSLDDAIQQCIYLRPSRIIIIPYLLFAGVLIQRLHEKMHLYQNRFSWIPLFVTPVLSKEHDSFLTYILQRTLSALKNNDHTSPPLPCQNCRYRIPISGHEEHVNGLKALLYSIRHAFTHTQGQQDTNTLTHKHFSVKRHILICNNVNCSQQGAGQTRLFLENEIKRRNWQNKIRITTCSCLGMCGNGPNLIIYPDGVWYNQINLQNAQKLLDLHLDQDRLLKENVYSLMD